MEFYWITIFIIIAVLSPGPDFFLVSKNAITYSRRIGHVTALGISCSTFIHSMYSILGLSVLFEMFPAYHNILKLLGASYFIYIGAKGLLTNKKTSSETTTLDFHSNTKAFVEGFLNNLLNPKTIVFFLTFFTVILNPLTSLSSKIFYSIEIACLHFVWFYSLSSLITTHSFYSMIKSVQQQVELFIHIIFISFGLYFLYMLS